MDEPALIRWVRRFSKEAGDDAAVLPFGKKDLLLKADMVVEGVHFERGSSRPADWGRKAVLCNISDIAAMGGKPLYALVSLGLPAADSLQTGKQIMRGALEACRLYDVRIVGGDTSRSDKAVVSVALAGEVAAGKAIRRSGARAGDRIFVTGPLGGSLASGWHLRFRPRLAESAFLVRNYRLHAMIDVSDGLSKDLRHIAEESGVGMRISGEALPLRKGIKDPRRAFTDGEDFELVFTLGSSDAARLLKDPRPGARRFTFYPIGRVVPRRAGLRLVARGKERPFPPIHDHHFWR